MSTGAYFDNRGDLWVPVAKYNTPQDVAQSSVMFPGPNGEAVQHINLTQYIRRVAMVDTLPRDGEG